MSAARLAAALAFACVAGCGPITVSGEDASDASTSDAAAGDGAIVDDGAISDARVVHGPYATRVVSFDPGEGAGFGQDRMPDVVLGPPVGAGDMRGGTDVVSLGRFGRICLAFDDVAIVDGPGPDFIVFENAFYAAGTSTLWAELGEVSVSDDGVTYHTFPCTQQGPPYTGCAGWNPVYSRPGGIAPDDVLHAGGDDFDLADIAVTRARFVCIRDLGTQSLAPPATGFDLDAIVAVNHAAP